MMYATDRQTDRRAEINIQYHLHIGWAYNSEKNGHDKLAFKDRYVRHSGDKNYPLWTKSTELHMFNFGDNIDRDTVDKVERAGDSRLSTNRRQIGDKVDCQLCRRFVASFGDCRLCRQCVRGLRMTVFEAIGLLLTLFLSSTTRVHYARSNVDDNNIDGRKENFEIIILFVTFTAFAWQEAHDRCVPPRPFIGGGRFCRL